MNHWFCVLQNRGPTEGSLSQFLAGYINVNSSLINNDCYIYMYVFIYKYILHISRKIKACQNCVWSPSTFRLTKILKFRFFFDTIIPFNVNFILNVMNLILKLQLYFQILKKSLHIFFHFFFVVQILFRLFKKKKISKWKKTTLYLTFWLWNRETLSWMMGMQCAVAWGLVSAVLNAAGRSGGKSGSVSRNLSHSLAGFADTGEL